MSDGITDNIKSNKAFHVKHDRIVNWLRENGCKVSFIYTGILKVEI